ncbi:hypothetical protein PAXRUDRAFT_35889 [Paxillus rubicundulus Ve08.2h10]|uniref:Uncharacterized protein n=1 Tax=Paxillus rubicundulus Ve08.2h10 TaxID=930991 RepID=A0A0D0DBA3_9AGAM|nr:hypothetical protein PAXRUDRAFT_35889 [Paxillus rubicundulus Ve08.2h10]
MHDHECRVVQSSQIHTCTRATCLRFVRHGNLVCKRRAPWHLSVEEYVDEHGDWNPKRTYGFLNNYCLAISMTICCNNDIKPLTNGKETKDAIWYKTDYATKKQSKNNNVSALMVKALLYHQDHSDHIDSLLKHNHMLLFQCQQAVNREMELSGPQVMAYLMGWGDNIHSHHYVTLYWSLVKRALLAAFPQLDQQHSRQEHRGDELASFSFLNFIVETYEESIPSNEHVKRITSSLPQRGRPQNERSHYHEQHPCSHTHCQVIWCKGHNTLTNIVGPWFPHCNDPTTHDLYCASMLALLTPWQEISTLKEDNTT